jgi:hypothetical protein
LPAEWSHKKVARKGRNAYAGDQQEGRRLAGHRQEGHRLLCDPNIMAQKISQNFRRKLKIILNMQMHYKIVAIFSKTISHYAKVNAIA